MGTRGFHVVSNEAAERRGKCRRIRGAHITCEPHVGAGPVVWTWVIRGAETRMVRPAALLNHLWDVRPEVGPLTPLHAEAAEVELDATRAARQVAVFNRRLDESESWDLFDNALGPAHIACRRSVHHTHMDMGVSGTHDVSGTLGPSLSEFDAR